MTDIEYCKKLYILTDELERAAKASPFDPDTYNDVIARLNALHSCYIHSPRRRSWFAFASCIVLLIILLWIVYTVLDVLYTRGT